MNNQLENLGQFQDPVQVMKTLAAHSPIGVQIYSRAGHSVFVNEAFRKMFGVIPPPDYCIWDDPYVESLGLVPGIRRAFAGEPNQLPIAWYDSRREDFPNGAYYKKYGKKCAFETNLAPIFAGDGTVSHVVFFVQDVTSKLSQEIERDKTLKELEQARRLTETVLDNTKAVIYVKNKEGRLMFVNAQYCHIFGKPAHHFIGMLESDLFPKENAEAFRKNDLHVMNTKSHLEVEEVAVHADGKPHTYISLKVPLLGADGEPYGICGISTDITEYRRLEEDLHKAKKMEAVGLLAGGIAHDFNNILGVILLGVETVLLKESSPSVKNDLQAIKKAAQSGALLTRQLLTFGKRQKVQPELLDFGLVLFNMKEMLENALGESSKLRIEVQPNLWSLSADRSQLEQIVTNLCLNARDAMPDGGQIRVTLRNEFRKSNTIAAPAGEYVELTVSDEGVGIKPEMLERIFEPFFTTKCEGKGTGLGLAIVYGIVQGAGGQILVDTRPECGSTFRVYWPRARFQLTKSRRIAPVSVREEAAAPSPSSLA